VPRREDSLLHRATGEEALKECECCEKQLKEGYSVTLRLCHNCRVDLEEWLERKKAKT
jgi:hypothetical protein